VKQYQKSERRGDDDGGKNYGISHRKKKRETAKNMKMKTSRAKAFNGFSKTRVALI
jgi:hypothetical protein